MTTISRLTGMLGVGLLVSLAACETPPPPPPAPAEVQRTKQIVATVESVDMTTRQVRALKVTPEDIPGVQPAAIEEYRRRFQAGAQYGIRINDPRVVHSCDFGHDGDLLILAMAYAPGGNLADRLWNLRLDGRLMNIDECVLIALDIADGLGAIHNQDVVYCNLKPSNVLFDADGMRAQLADLGLAQLPGGVSMFSQVGQAGWRHPGSSSSRST